MLAALDLAPLILSLAGGALVQVEGDTGCPTPAEVAARVDRFLGPRPADVEPDRAELRAGERGVRVALRRPDGTLVGDRTVERDQGGARAATCADMADAVAVVIVIWELPLRPGIVPPLDPVTARARAADATVVAAGPAPPPEPGWRFELGAAFQEVLPAAQPGAVVEGVLRSRAGGWGARVALGGAWWNQDALGPGRVSWTRLALGVGLIHGWSGRRLFLDLREQALAGALVADGQGFDQTRRSTAFEPGVGAGLRAGAWLGARSMLWVDGGVTFWPVHQRLQVQGLPDGVDAARFEVAVSVGFSIVDTR